MNPYQFEWLGYLFVQSVVKYDLSICLSKGEQFNFVDFHIGFRELYVFSRRTQ